MSSQPSANPKRVLTKAVQRQRASAKKVAKPAPTRRLCKACNRLLPIPYFPKGPTRTCTACKFIASSDNLSEAVRIAQVEKRKALEAGLEFVESVEFKQRVEAAIEAKAANLEFDAQVARKAKAWVQENPDAKELPKGDLVKLVRAEMRYGTDEASSAETVEKAAGKLLTERLEGNEAQREIATRTLLRRRFDLFVRRMDGSIILEWVHEDVCRRLQRFMHQVEREEGPRLILTMPPRHTKSTLASVMFPSYVLGQHPDWEMIVASYGLSLAVGFSRKVQDFVRDKRYKALFRKTGIDPKNQGAEQWGTTQKGFFNAAGVGGPLTGKGAHIAVVDDPHKDAAEADSLTMRELVWNWFDSVLKTRLMPGGGIILVLTRWNDDDLAGRLIAQEKALIKELDELIRGAQERLALAPEEQKAECRQLIAQYNEEYAEIDRWEIVDYPAIAVEDEYLLPDGRSHKGAPPIPHMLDEDGEPKLPPEDAVRPLSRRLSGGVSLLRHQGEALHPKRYPLERLKKLKRGMQPRFWNALYQQNPVPAEGEFFTKSMFRYANSPMSAGPGYYMYQAWDLAIGERQQNDYTVGVCGLVDSNMRVFLLDRIRARLDTAGIVDAILNFYAKYPETLLVGIERGQLQLAITSVLRQEMRARTLFPSLAEGDDALVPITDKIVRARPLQGLLQQGMLIFPPGQSNPWIEEMEAELLRFPVGKFDDQVDALAWLVRMALKRGVPRRQTPKKLPSWRDRLLGRDRQAKRYGGAMGA